MRRRHDTAALAAAFFLSCSPALADVIATSGPVVVGGEAVTTPLTPVAGHGDVPSVPGTTAVRLVGENPKKRTPFALRHPKLHKVGRRVRKFCQITTPVVQFCGAVGQIVTPFIIH